MPSLEGNFCGENLAHSEHELRGYCASHKNYQEEKEQKRCFSET